MALLLKIIIITIIIIIIIIINEVFMNILLRFCVQLFIRF